VVATGILVVQHQGVRVVICFRYWRENKSTLERKYEAGFLEISAVASTGYACLTGLLSASNLNAAIITAAVNNDAA
jgi:hypothetical protein